MTCLAPPPVRGSGLYATDRSLCWDAGDTIKVQFLDGSPEEAAFVLKTASEWSRFANIRFAAVKTGGDVRVTFNALGFAARIGQDALTTAEDEPTVLLGFGSSPLADWRRHVLHEFGHVLGFSHEHRSPAANIRWNKSAVIQFYTNLKPPWTVKQIYENILDPPTSSGNATWTQFDPKSIMLYPVPKEHTEDHVEFGWNTELSEMDKQKAAELYKW
jgi:hypothetical protein